MDGECNLSVSRFDQGFLISITGHGTMRQSAAFREFVVQCFQSQQATVVVDFAACEYLDSTFLGCLIGLHKDALRHGRKFLIGADQAQRTRLFATSVLDQLFEFVDQAPAATCEFVPLSTPPLDARELGLHVMQSHQRLAELGGKDAVVFQSIADRLSKELE